LWRTYARSGEDRLLAIAAGVVFFGLLAVFPAITALVSCYGLFANPATIGGNLQTLALMLPEGSFQIVQDQRQGGNGSASARWPPPCYGSLAPSSSPGICRISEITMQPMVRWVPPSG
jgi:membrane protein